MTTLRITAGQFRGRRIPVPRGELRPTSELARQAYFDIVSDRIDGARFVDLFAGSGIFSFEALSRGAATATAIDKSRAYVEAIRRTATSLGIPVTAVTADAVGGMTRGLSGGFDLLYADPPYAYEDYRALLEAIDASPQLADGALVALEHRRRTTPFQFIDETPLSRLRLQRRAEYGEIWITFFIHEAA